MNRALLLFLLALAAPALAGTDGDLIAAKLTHHLNGHGQAFVAKEAKRLEIGDASESGAKDDVREGCPAPSSCFATHALDLKESQDAVYFLSANRAGHLLSDEIERFKRHPHDPEAMIRLQQAMQKWSLMTQMQTQMIKEMDETLKSIIQKM